MPRGWNARRDPADGRRWAGCWTARRCHGWERQRDLQCLGKAREAVLAKQRRQGHISKRRLEWDCDWDRAQSRLGKAGPGRALWGRGHVWEEGGPGASGESLGEMRLSS